MVRKAKIAAIAAVVVILALCGWRAWTDARASNAPSEEQQNSEEPTVTDEVDLDDEQRRLVAAYTSDMDYVSEILEGNLWESDEGSYAEFSRGGVVERAGGKTDAQPFVITAVEHEARGDGAGGSIDVWTCSAISDSGESIFTLSQARTVDAGTMPWSVSCSAFALAGDYELVKRANGVEVSDLSAARPVIGGEQGEANVRAAIEEHAAMVAPTATKAEWDGVAEVDFGNGIARFTFTLNDSSKTSVDLSVSIDSGEVSFQ